MLPDGGDHGRRLWVPLGARGLQLVGGGERWCLGDSGPPGSRGGGSPHTSLAWMCALGFGDPPPWRKEAQRWPRPPLLGRDGLLREKAVSQEPEEPTLRVEPQRRGWSRFSVACRDGAGEGQGVAFSWCGLFLPGGDTEAKPHTPRAQVAGLGPPLTPPLGSLAQEPHLPAPATGPASQSQESLGPVGLETPHNPANRGGTFFPPNCRGDQVPVTTLLTGTQTARGERGGEAPGGHSGPGLAQPLLDTRSRALVLFLARQGQSPGGGLGKDPAVSKLAGEKDAEQPCRGAGGGGTLGGELERDHLPA
ncbi:uncharacterized protein LOC113932964 [Zalophus californianus]|uniref:Uncharacterized protein LOC113932964 n=1 Tax=Zalophus californianus TaxID=9704 RepID=A0A6J2EHD3_ZALCA|nr:uncharacterized protein LOC113932964 [Zalophus californianus]